MADALGGYYTLGRWFAKMIGNPEVMRLATKYGLPRTTLMRFLLKVMANLAEPHGGDADDRLINAHVEDGARRMTRRACRTAPLGLGRVRPDCPCRPTPPAQARRSSIRVRLTMTSGRGVARR